MKLIVKVIVVILVLTTFVFLLIRHFKKNNNYGSVIIVNGVSSVGKSSIIKSFQRKSKKAWLAIGIDNFFVGVLPEKFYLEDKPEHHTIMRGIASVDESENKLFTLNIGKEGQKVINGMFGAIGAYARAGNNLIVDYINYDPSWIKKLKSSLQGIKIIFVGIKASLKTIEEREKERATSPVGHARSHYESIHDGMDYHLEINYENITADKAADKIINFLQQNKLS